MGSGATLENVSRLSDALAEALAGAGQPAR
jgi:hypothetical protein